SMAVTTGTSVALFNPSTPVVPILQAQGGSFIGTLGNDFVRPLGNGMVAFDQSGNVRWTVPNEEPKIATADGGVIGKSGIMYDQNGSVTGQVGTLPTYSWKGAYQRGSTICYIPAFDHALMGRSYAATPKGNLTENGFSLVLHTFGIVFCGPEGSGPCPSSF